MSAEPQRIELTAEQTRLVMDWSARTGMTPQEVLDDVLRQYVRRFGAECEGRVAGKSLYDALAWKGLIGCIKGGPTDLSTNPKYMEGFGKDPE
jgi:hypothetical protein